VQVRARRQAPARQAPLPTTRSAAPPRYLAVVREVGLALVAAGCVVLLFVLFELVGTNLLEQRSQASLARSFQSQLSRESRPPATVAVPPPSRPSPSPARARPRPAAPAGTGRAGAARAPLRHHLAVTLPGGVLDHLVIPAIGVDRYVVQGVGEADLQMGPGHYPGTPLPGQPGNVGIAGHRTTFGAPFFRLNELVRGDLIYLTDTSGTTWVYSVTRQWVVAPSDVGVLSPTPGAQLTLTTCNPRFEATSRLVVRAALVRGLGQAAAVPTTGLPSRLAALGPWLAQANRQAGTRPSTSAPAPATTSPPGPARRPAQPAPSPLSPTPARGTNPLPASPRGPAASPALASAGGSGVWLGTLGWGALAVAMWAGTRIWARRLRRYRKVAALSAGALACLVPLWPCFEDAVRLLPANF